MTLDTKTKLGSTSKPLDLFNGSYGETNYDTKPQAVSEVTPKIGRAQLGAPAQVSMEEKQRVADINSGISYGDRQAGRAESALGNVLTGAGRVISSLPKAAGEISGYVTGESPDESVFTQAGEGFDKFLQESLDINPAYQKEFSQEFAQGLGSVLGNLGGGAIGAVMKAPMAVGGLLTGMTSMGVEGVGDLKKSMKDQGLDIDADDRMGTFITNAAVGATEMIPISKALSRLNKVTDGGWKDILKSGVKGTFEEATQEFVQQTASNLIARDIIKYDEKRGIFTDAAHAAEVGGAVGFALNVLTSAIGGRRASKFTTDSATSDALTTETVSPEGKTLPGFEKTKGELVKESIGETAGPAPAVNPETNQKFQTSDFQSLSQGLSDYRNSIEDGGATSTQGGYLELLIEAKDEVKRLSSPTIEGGKPLTTKELIAKREGRALLKSIEETISDTREDLKSPDQVDMFLGGEAEALIPDSVAEPRTVTQGPQSLDDLTQGETTQNDKTTEEANTPLSPDPVAISDPDQETLETAPEDLETGNVSQLEETIKSSPEVIKSKGLSDAEVLREVELAHPDVILTKKGKLFKSRPAAKRVQNRNEGSTIQEVDGGFFVVPSTEEAGGVEESAPVGTGSVEVSSSPNQTITSDEGGVITAVPKKGEVSPTMDIPQLEDELDAIDSELLVAEDDALYGVEDLRTLKAKKRLLNADLARLRSDIDTSSAESGQEFNGAVPVDEDELRPSFVGTGSESAGLNLEKSLSGISRPLISGIHRMAKGISSSGKDTPPSIISAFNNTNEFIRKRTGWHLGIDSMWRYEISDRNSRLEKETSPEMSLGDLLYHDTLYTHYPFLLKTKVNFTNIDLSDKTTLGSISSSGEISLNPNLVNYPHVLRSTLHHEIQHLIQAREGFGRGGDPSLFIEGYNSKLESIEFLKSVVTKPEQFSSEDQLIEYQANLKELQEDVEAGYSKYQRLLGEVEARSVQSRMNFNDFQTLTESPYSSEGISTDQFILRDGSGVQASVIESADIPSMKLNPTRLDGTKTYSLKTKEGMSQRDTNNYNAAIEAFNKFVGKVHASTLKDVTFLLSSEMSNDLSIPEHVKEKVRGSLGEEKSTDGLGLFIYDSETGRKFIAINPLSAITNDQLPTARVADNVSQTLFHETVGHYGMRRVFQGRSGYDNFLGKVLTKNRKVLLEVLKLKDRWGTRKNSVGEVISGTIDLSPQTGMPTITLLDRDGISVTYDKEGLISLADEYVAELAKDFRNPEVVKKYGTGIKNFVKRLTAYIKHKLRGLMGSGADNVTQDDIMQLLAESRDRIFHNETIESAGQQLRNDLESYSDLAGVEPTGLSPSQEQAVRMDKDTTTELSYQVANGIDSKAGKLALDVGATAEDINNIDKAIHGNTAQLSQSNWQKSISEFKENLKTHPLWRRMSAMGNITGPKMLSYLENTLKGNIAQSEQLAKRVYDSLKDLDPAQEVEVYAYFTSPDIDVESLNITDLQKSLVLQSKRAIIKNGEDLVALGLLDKQKFEENKGAYLPNVYLKYMNTFSGGHGKRKSFSNWLKQSKDLSEQEKISLGQIKSPAFLVSETIGTIGRDVALENFYNLLINTEATKQYGWILGDKISVEVNGIKMGMAQIDNDIELKETLIRRDSGTSPHYNTEEGIAQLKSELEDLYSAKLSYETAFNESISKILRKMGEEPTPEKIDEFRTANYKKLEEKGFGHLTGLWIRKELHNDLMDYRDMGSMEGQDFMSETFGANGRVDKAHSWWKASKVIFNPPSWFRNAVSNFILLEISSTTSSGKLAQSVYEEVQSMRSNKPSEWYDLSIEAGLSNTTFTANELYLINKDAQARYGRELDSHKHQKDTGIASTFNNSFGFMTGKFYDSVSYATQVYGDIETVFKVTKLKDYIQNWERENGGKSYKDLPDGERRALISAAADSANDAIFDYSKVPAWMKSMRRMPLGSPFLTFTYKAFPAVMESLARRPQKFVKYMALPYMITQALAMSQDLDDEDIEEIKGRMPGWMREKGSMYILPYKNSDGKFDVLDVGPFLPWSPHINAGLSAIHAFDDDNGVLAPLAATKNLVTDLGFLGGPLPEMIRAIGTNKDSFTGREIIPSAGTSNQKAAAFYNYMHTLWLPSWIGPQGVTGHLMDNMGLSLITPSQTLNSFGTQKETTTGALLRGVGVNIYSVDPRESHQSNLKTFKFKENEIKKERTKYMKNRNVPASEKPKGLRDFNEKMKRLREKRAEYLEGAGS